jgi:hypothetical protein
MQNKKRGYFFVLDAVLGLFVLIIGVFIVTSSYVSVPPPTQVRLLSDDLLNFLSQTKIKNMNDPYAGIGGQLWNQGEITDGDNTLLQQIGEFYYLNKLDTAEQFIQSVSEDVMPAQFRYEAWVDSTLIYPKTPTPEHIASKSSTELLLTSKTITFGIVNKTSDNLWGPYKAEVFVWER